MAQERILVVDDEQDIIGLIKYNLKNEGYDVMTAMTGEKAVEIAFLNHPDLIVLDLMLPGIDGFDVTRQLRGKERTSEIPIVMLTARGEETDVIKGLDLGVNDYMSKPFSPKELIARIRGILRRRTDTSIPVFDQVIRIKDLVIDRGRHRVTIEGREISLTLMEFELLAFLAANKGWVFTRGQIVDAIHGESYAVTDRSVDVIIVGLRRKLKHYSHVIETVRGLGYRFQDNI